jgi:hypothetical protein
MPLEGSKWVYQEDMKRNIVKTNAIACKVLTLH